MKNIRTKAISLMATFCLFNLLLGAASCTGEKAIINPAMEDGGGGDKPPGYPKPPPRRN